MSNAKLFACNTEVEFCDTVFKLFEFASCVNQYRPNPVLHKHSYYEIHLGLGETCMFSSEKRDLPLQKNTMLVITPGEYHYTLPHDQMSEMLVIKFNLRKIQHPEHIYNSIIARLDEMNLSTIPVGDALMQSAVEFSKIQVHNPQTSCHLKVAAYTMFHNLLEELHVFDNPMQADAQQMDSDMDLIVLEELINTGQYSLNEIASLLGYSVKQTYRMIIKIYGEPLRELRKHRMLENVKKLLADNPDLSVGEAAKNVGIKSTSSFYKTFRKFEGCTPAKYKNNKETKEHVNE